MRTVGLLSAIVWTATLLVAGEPVEEKIPPPKPYVFSLSGLKSEDLEALRNVPGVREVVFDNAKVRVVFQPFNDNPWCKAAEGKPKWIKGAERFYDFLPIKKQVGRTRWTHGGLGDINTDTIIWYGPILSGSKSYPMVFNMMFDDLETKQNDVMSFRFYSDCDPNQLEHEMLRGLVGERIRIEKCGKGHALVAGEGRQAHVAWQVSELAFVRIDFCFDREMVAAYIDRLGCITPPDYKVSLDKWVEEEIHWRMMQIDFNYNWEVKNNVREYAEYDIRNLMSYFPEVGQKFGRPQKDGSPSEIWPYLGNYHNFLWVNRANFKYQPSAGWFVLKGKDLYDPEHLPELPEELRGPPKPTEAQIRASDATANERAIQAFRESYNGQLNDWNRQYQAGVTSRQNRFNFDVSYPFTELRGRMRARGGNLKQKEADAWLQEARGWLWANRDNFEHRTGGYFLKGKDLYDPEHPPELPEDLRGQPKVVPSPERTKQGTPKGP